MPKVAVISPEASVFEGTTDSVVAPGYDGEFGILSEHAPMMTLLGKDSGGLIGLAIGGTLAALIGQTGAAIIGGALLVAGLLLVTGASTGAILRRTGHADEWYSCRRRRG